MSEPFFSDIRSSSSTSFPDSSALPVSGAGQVENASATPMLASRDNTSAAPFQQAAAQGALIVASTRPVLTEQRTASEAELKSGNANWAMHDSSEAHPEVLRLKELVVDGRLQLKFPVSTETLRALTVLVQDPRYGVRDLLIFGMHASSMAPGHVDALSAVLKVNGTLATLTLRGMRIDAAAAAALSEALRDNCTLVTLYLEGNEIGADGAAALSEALKVNRTLAMLDFLNNEIGDAGAAALSEALKVNSALTTLHLMNNNIGAAGAAALSEGLKVNGTLATLHLAHNKIGPTGAAALSEALKVNRALVTLPLGKNEIGDAGAAALSEALKVNRALARLHLRYNDIGDAGAAALSEAAKMNVALIELHLDEHELNDAYRRQFASILQRNRQFSKLKEGATVALELASNRQYPTEIMAGIIEQMAALPPGRAADGLVTIAALSRAIGYPRSGN